MGLGSLHPPLISAPAGEECVDNVFFMRVFVLLCAALAALEAQSGSDPQTWYNRGRLYSNLSRLAFEQLVKIAPESAYVLSLLGEVKV